MSAAPNAAARCCAAARSSSPRLGLGLLALDLPFVAGRHGQRQFARQQEIARVAVGDLHHLATIAEVFHVLSENDFGCHECLPP
jgi:hypothetical protein